MHEPRPRAALPGSLVLPGRRAEIPSGAATLPGRPRAWGPTTAGVGRRDRPRPPLRARARAGAGEPAGR
ncbi:hypothetical protein OG994_15725 [Micromonospora globbae]|uniref:Uncharacterized protein n=1 Tax=Micromonospora globbae TaxID=1894969 RepID=A0ABZ1RZ63_9ACTN|nr:hypothetical protein [Micromonospora globbae]